MVLNPFFQQGSTSEQNLVQSLINEQLQIYGVNVHYIPVHTQPYYQKMGFEKGMFPNSERYYESALSLPLYQDITEDDLQYVCKVLREGIV